MGMELKVIVYIYVMKICKEIKHIHVFSITTYTNTRILFELYQ